MIPQLSHPSPIPRGYIEPVQEEQSTEASLVDVVRSIFRVLGMLRRYAWILVPLPVVCAGVAWSAIRRAPGIGSRSGIGGGDYASSGASRSASSRRAFSH